LKGDAPKAPKKKPNSKKQANGRNTFPLVFIFIHRFSTLDATKLAANTDGDDDSTMDQ